MKQSFLSWQLNPQHNIVEPVHLSPFTVQIYRLFPRKKKATGGAGLDFILDALSEMRVGRQKCFLCQVDVCFPVIVLIVPF